MKKAQAPNLFERGLCSCAVGHQCSSKITQGQAEKLTWAELLLQPDTMLSKRNTGQSNPMQNAHLCWITLLKESHISTVYLR